jgi:hypothetical protein
MIYTLYEFDLIVCTFNILYNFDIWEFQNVFLFFQNRKKLLSARGVLNIWYFNVIESIKYMVGVLSF